MTVTTPRPDPALPDGRQSEAVRRQALGAFLRSRRGRITPEQVGLASGGRRRTPGLRREEVAQLAGVGVTWYTWLEQGRDIRASEQVLGAVATTLRLDAHERCHLFALAGTQEPVRPKDCKAVSEPVQQMLRQLDPLPAVVRNARTDILAFNNSYNRLVGDLDTVPFAERNALLLAFTRPAWRARIVDWDDSAPTMVAQFRADMAQHVAEPAWKNLVKQLRQESAEFDALWNQHEVRTPENLAKRYLHPEVGILTLNYTYLWFGRRSELRLTTFTPADQDTDAKLRALHEPA